MKTNFRRSLSAYLLLAVYLPTFLLASLHVHDTEVAVEADCNMCAEHVPHVGHLQPARATLHDCALCTFLALNYMAAPVVLVIYYRPRLSACSVARDFQVRFCVTEHRIPRAPPVC